MQVGGGDRRVTHANEDIWYMIECVKMLLLKNADKKMEQGLMKSPLGNSCYWNARILPKKKKRHHFAQKTSKNLQKKQASFAQVPGRAIQSICIKPLPV